MDNFERHEFRNPRDNEPPTQEMLEEVLRYIETFSEYNTHDELIRDEQTGEVIDVVSHKVDSTHAANSLPHFRDERDPQITYVFFCAMTDEDIQAGKVGDIQKVDVGNPDKAHITKYELKRNQEGLIIERFSLFQRIFHMDNEDTDGDGSFVSAEEIKAAREIEESLGLLTMSKQEVQDLLDTLASAQLIPTS